MGFRVGQVVFSKAGRDKGYPMLVFKEEDGFVFVVDGKERPLSRPKRKNPKHLRTTNTVIDESDMANDAKIKKLLRRFILEE